MRKLINTKSAILLASVCAAATVAVVGNAGGPVDGKLVIDDEIEIITRAAPPEGHPLKEVISGWHYRTEETRELETDTFQNPGYLAIEQGEEIWNTAEGTEGKSCADCHGDAGESMASVGATYPKWHDKLNKPVNVELAINYCRTENMGADAYKFDKGGQKPLTAYIKNQALGKPVNIDLSEGEMQTWWENGKETYYKRTGQLNLSCASCHEKNNGKYIRADHLSQGNINGFPTYRLKQNKLISVHNRFRGCIRDTRAEFPDAFSDELMGLEVYLTWRGTGLSVETPAVRQ